jgi:medium-chain acyl-[acyl-carrier-protein] hydrolase
MVPVAQVPAQDIGPWQQAVARLTSDREHYADLSRQSRAAAVHYADNLTAAPCEAFLEKVMRSPRRPRTESPAAEKLSPERRKLLALRLHRMNSARWFPNAENRAPFDVRLFCFPHAGGGASGFARWSEHLPAGVSICAARLPGRESRAAEAPLIDMDALVSALAEALQPYLGKPFAFFGHSMGAVVAFELAQHLRRKHQPLPKALYVSGVRAPRFRLGWVPPPEPNESQFLEELRRLEGVPREALENEDLLRLILPALRADTALYRNYVYMEQPPLDCPIRVYGGASDPNVTREHLEAWVGQTTGSFAVRVFPGGHFFLQTGQREFLDALAADLSWLLAAQDRDG